MPTAERGQHNEIVTQETRKAGKMVRRVTTAQALITTGATGRSRLNNTTPESGSIRYGAKLD